MNVTSRRFEALPRGAAVVQFTTAQAPIPCLLRACISSARRQTDLSQRAAPSWTFTSPRVTSFVLTTCFAAPSPILVRFELRRASTLRSERAAVRVVVVEGDAPAGRLPAHLSSRPPARARRHWALPGGPRDAGGLRRADRMRSCTRMGVLAGVDDILITLELSTRSGYLIAPVVGVCRPSSRFTPFLLRSGRPASPEHSCFRVSRLARLGGGDRGDRRVRPP